MAGVGVAAGESPQPPVEWEVWMSMTEAVVNRLRETRQEHGLTQEQLASALGVTRHTILALEVGRYVPSIELALRLAAYFDRPLETLFWLTPDIDHVVRGAAPQPQTAEPAQAGSEGRYDD